MNWAILITTVLGGLTTAFAPQVGDLMSQHPTVSGIIVAIFAVLNNLSKSVVTPKV